MNGLLDLVGAVAGPLLDRLFPDPTEKAKAQLELLRLQQEGQFKEFDSMVQIALAQAATNTAEAGRGATFSSTWRPAVGWVCVMAFFYAGLLRPLLPWVCEVAGVSVPPLPPIDDVFGELLFGMLGLGGLRTFEKYKGRA